MRPADIFFYGIIFFLIGVFAHSVGVALSVLFLAVFVAELFFLVAFVFSQKNVFIFFAVIVVGSAVGAAYAEWHDKKFERATNILFDREQTFNGFVASDPTMKEDAITFAFQLYAPWSGRVTVKTNLYPQFSYGDELRLTGTVTHPFSESYAKYLAKEGISGAVSFPKAEAVGTNGGSEIRRFLFLFKGKITDAIRKVLPPLEAAFMNGLMLGGRSEFPKEFQDAMSASGTTHLVALSGYNITIIVWVAMGMLAFVVNRRAAFWLATAIILFFVLMTGAEASVVRAALMGTLVLFAENRGRASSIRNSIAFTALIMVIANPNVLVFDLGFQLSFLALFGILFLRPALKNVLHMESAGFLSWKDNLITTFSAQIAVAPLLMINFGTLSLTSLAANVLILEIIPVAMGLGFIAAALSFLSYYGSLVIGLTVLPLLQFGIFIIELFARWSIPLNMEMTISVIVLYYACIIWFINFWKK